MTVSFEEGVWRLVDDERSTTIHGREPQREADRVVAGLLEAGETDLLVVIGLGLGFVLDALERRQWTGRVLAIEPEPATVAAMRQRRDWSSWTAQDRLRVLVAPAFEGATECWQWFGDGSHEPRLYVHPVMERVRPEAVASARATLKRILFDTRSNAEAKRRHGARYLANTLRNLPAIAVEPGASRLLGAARGVPAVVVAAGPSLDSSVSALRDVPGKALIIAVDTALRPLLAAGIHPHAVVAVDPSEANGRHLTDLPACDDTYLVSEGSIDPFAVAAFRGRTFFFDVSDHQPWPWLHSLGVEGGRLRAWGSVLTSAFDLTLALGADPIFFVGADLSYPGERPYCRGVSFEETWRGRARFGEPPAQQWREAIGQWPAVYETDVSGAPVRTAPHLVTFRDWLVEQMQRDRSRRFINAGGAGILKGAAIAQTTPQAMAAQFAASESLVPHPFRERYRQRDGRRVHEETRRLAARAVEGDLSIAVFREWETFAPLFTVEAIAQALSAADKAFDNDDRGRTATAAATPAGRIETDVQALVEMAAAVPLVPLPMDPHRLDIHVSGARMFRFRTTAAAIITCAMRSQQSGVSEDGIPLTRVYGLDVIRPGTYAVHRDLVLFRATDGTDPRTNGRQYTILVPGSVAYLEALPLADILDRDI
jgi:hypothetical protein